MIDKPTTPTKKKMPKPPKPENFGSGQMDLFRGSCATRMQNATRFQTSLTFGTASLAMWFQGSSSTNGAKREHFRSCMIFRFIIGAGNEV